jgi:nicotinamide riboside kinase
MHRIAFAGASGTGKTTLARYVAAQLGLPLAPSAARAAAAEMGLGSPYDADRLDLEVKDLPHLQGQATTRRTELQRLIVRKRIEWQHDHAIDGFVSDRTSFDDLAYTLIHCGEPLYAELLTPVFNQDQVLQPTYTTIVFCPMASFFSLGTDPARNPDLGYHREFERLLLELLDKARSNVDLSLCRVAADKRTQWATEFVTELLKGDG